MNQIIKAVIFRAFLFTASITFNGGEKESQEDARCVGFLFFFSASNENKIEVKEKEKEKGYRFISNETSRKKREMIG